MHLRLAEAVQSREERARHLAFGSQEADEAVASVLVEGADAARARGGLHSAAELLERAREFTPSSSVDAARERGILAAELHVHAFVGQTAYVLVTVVDPDVGGSLRATVRSASSSRSGTSFRRGSR
jgi:hypothetical protein